MSSLLAQAQHPPTSQLQLEIIYVEKVDGWNKSKSYLGLRSPTSFKPKSLYLKDSFVLTQLKYENHTNSWPLFQKFLGRETVFYMNFYVIRRGDDADGEEEEVGQTGTSRRRIPLVFDSLI